MLKDVDEVLEAMRIEEEPPANDEIQPTEKFVEIKGVTDFKGFEGVLDTDDQLLCFDVETEARQMYDGLRRSFETCNKTVTNWHRTSTVKIYFMHSWQLTLHDMLKQ